MNKKSLSISIIFLLLLSLFPLSFVPDVFAVHINYIEGGDCEIPYNDWDQGLTYGNFSIKEGDPQYVNSTLYSHSNGWHISTDTTGDFFTYNLTDAYYVNTDNIINFTVWVRPNEPSRDIAITYYYEEGDSDFEEMTVLLDDVYTQVVLDGYESDRTFIGVKLGYGNPSSVFRWDDFELFVNEEEEESVSLDTTDLEDFQGEAPFVFVDWKYYEFVPDVPDGVLNSTDIDFLFMQFTIPTIEGMVAVAPYYDNQTGVWGLITNSSDQTRYGDYLLIQDGSVSNSSFTFKLWFEDTCLDVWDALDCVDVQIGWNETDGWAEPWHVFENEFRVYNDGGFVANTGITGNAGVLPGGRDMSMFGYNETNVYKELAWRDAVHVKVQPTVYFRAGYSDFYMYYEFNYVMDDGIRRPGLQLVLIPDFVAYSGVFASNIWINMTCNWYYNNGLIKEDSLYMFYHGSVSNIGDSGNFLFYVDLWFDNQNASQLIGGRVNAFEYPVHDSADVWFRWLSSNWGIKDDVKKQSECFTPLLRSDNSTFSVEEIKFVLYKQILNVPGVSGSDQFVAISDYGIFDVTMAQQLPMRGISTPPWDETSMPGVGNHGVFGAIFSLFSGIGGWLSENVLFGGLNLWGSFVAFLDTIAGWLGAPGFFSFLFEQIAEGLTYLYEAAGYVVGMLSGVFSLFGELLGVFVTMVGDLILGFVDFLTIFTDMMAGGYGAGVNIWEDLGISTWITIAMIFYPLYLVFLWEKEGLDAVFNQLSMIFGLLVGIYTLLEGIILGVVQLITSLIESIPVAE